MVKDNTEKKKEGEVMIGRYIFHKGEVKKMGEVPLRESHIYQELEEGEFFLGVTIRKKLRSHTRSPRPITMEDLERLGDPLPEGIVFRKLDI